jgi:hypothetical protein
MRDFIAYVLISIVAVAVIIFGAIKTVSDQRFLNYTGLAIFTVCVFGQFILTSKYVWTRRLFWALCATAFIAHLVLCAWLFHIEGTLSGEQWLVLAFAEIFVLVYSRKFAFGSNPPRRK